jgi:hypothetical protein
MPRQKSPPNHDHGHDHDHGCKAHYTIHHDNMELLIAASEGDILCDGWIFDLLSNDKRAMS